MTQPTPGNSPFAITAATSTVNLDASHKGEATFTVTNVSGRSLTGRALVDPVSSESESWFALATPIERPFQPNEVFQYTVDIAAPAAAPASTQTVTLNMVDVANPDEFFSAGPAVSVLVPGPAVQEKPFPWAIPIAALVVIGIIAVAAYILLRPEPEEANRGEVALAHFDLVDLDTSTGKSDLTFDDLFAAIELTPESEEYRELERRGFQIDFWYLVAKNNFAYDPVRGRATDGEGLSFGEGNPAQFILVDTSYLIYVTGATVIDMRTTPTEAACRNRDNSPSRVGSTQLTGRDVSFCIQTTEGKRSFVQMSFGANRSDPALMRWSTE